MINHSTYHKIFFCILTWLKNKLGLLAHLIRSILDRKSKTSKKNFLDAENLLIFLMSFKLRLKGL